MKILHFLTYFIIVTLLLSTSVFWNDEDDEKKTSITDITYSWFFNEAEKVTITWKDFDKCDLKIWEKSVEPISQSETQIEVSMDYFEWPNGIIYIDCAHWSTNQEFRFPYIERVDLDGINSEYKNITIRWKNLKKVTSVNIEWGDFKISGQSDTLIMGNLPVKIKEKEISLSSNNLKSNEFPLDIKIPKITYISAENWFYVENKVKIFWENIFDENQFKLYVWNDKIDDYKMNKDLKFIEFTLWNKIGNLDIYIEKNKFISNSIPLNIHGDKLKITKISEKSYTRDVTNERVEAIVLTAKNIPFNEDDMKVYHNGVELDGVSIENDEIYLNYLKLDGWNNFFKVSVNGKYSNTVNKIKDMDFPSIVDIEKTKLDKDGNRIVTLNIQWFSSSTDEIYYMNSKLPIVGCYSGQCRVQLYPTTVNGHFNVSRNWSMSPEIFEFDFSNNLKPYIEYISFPSWFKPGAPVVIVWNKFDSASVNGINLFRTRDWKLDIKVSDTKISGNLPIDFNKTLLSTLYVSNYGSNQKIDFTAETISWSKIYWPGIIESVKNTKKGELITTWSKVVLRWKWIKLWDSIVFWDEKVKLLFEKWNPFPEFTIPKVLEAKEHKVKIVNVNNIESEEFWLFIYKQWQKPQLRIKNEKLVLPELMTNKQNIGSLLKIKLQNTVSKVRINSIEFDVDADDYSEVGTFKLQIDNREVWTSLVNFGGKLLFDRPFDLYEWWKEYTLTLSKVSHFWEMWDIKISLLKDWIDAASYDRSINTVPIFIEKSDVSVDLLVKNEEIEKCIPYKTWEWFCEKEDKKNTETKNNDDEKIEDKKPVDEKKSEDNLDDKTSHEEKNVDNSKYASIDAKLEKVYKSYSRKPIRTQIKVFKSLSFQLKKLLQKTKPWARKDAINFIYNDVNNHYKKLFKQYILSKKKN